MGQGSEREIHHILMKKMKQRADNDPESDF